MACYLDGSITRCYYERRRPAPGETAKYVALVGLSVAEHYGVGNGSRIQCAAQRCEQILSGFP